MKARVLLAAIVCLTAISGAIASGAAARTGFNEFKIDVSSTQAGGHPDIAIHVNFDVRNLEHGAPVAEDPKSCVCEDMNELGFHMPTGFIGNPHAVPRCTLSDFSLELCPPETQVGVLFLNIFENEGFGQVTPIYSLVPHPDEAGLLATVAPLINIPIQISISGRTGSDYGLDAVSRGAFHWLPIIQLHTYLWGSPADPSHDLARFPLPHGGNQSVCIGTPTDTVPSQQKSEEIFFAFGCHPPTPSNAANVPFLQNPTTCGVPLSAGADITYYTGLTSLAETAWPATTGCDQLKFSPSLTVKPTTTQAETMAGMDVSLAVPQPQSATVPSPSEIKETVVKLPAGLTLAPNAADGKTACADDQLNFFTEDGAECPEFAKIGTVELDSSALPGPIGGSIYLGQPLPNERFRIFLTADGFATHVKLKGTARLDAVTGQITATFANLPQSPFQRFDLHFFGAERGSFVTPTHCGTYQVEALFVPWDDALPNQTTFSSFEVDSGAGGGPCPREIRPFNPVVRGGTQDNTAGVSSPLSFQLKREDGEQFLRNAVVHLPSGLVQSLKGLTECSEGALATVALASHTGLQELGSPACPPSSEVGTVVAGAGAGTRPIYNRGKVYLAGPYKGAPVSLAVIVPALGGPYDLGNVTDRIAAYVDPTTARITAVSDPVPQIIEGVPLRVRSLLLNFNRPDFNRTPTNCSPKSIETELTGDQGTVVTPSSVYQVANCSTLAFSPGLELRLIGSTKRRGHPALRARLTAKPGEANIARTTVALPKATLLDNAHIGTVCTRVQFAARSCPPDSIYGRAVASTPLLDGPLSGPVYLRSSTHELPDLVADLNGQIRIELVGTIDTTRKGALRATFDSVPDAPVSAFELEMEGARQGLLINSEDLCKGKRFVALSLTGQNGAVVKRNTPLQTSCRGGTGSAKKRHHRGSRRAGAGR